MCSPTNGPPPDGNPEASSTEIPKDKSGLDKDPFDVDGWDIQSIDRSFDRRTATAVLRIIFATDQLPLALFVESNLDF